METLKEVNYTASIHNNQVSNRHKLISSFAHNGQAHILKCFFSNSKMFIQLFTLFNFTLCTLYIMFLGVIILSNTEGEKKSQPQNVDLQGPKHHIDYFSPFWFG